MTVSWANPSRPPGLYWVRVSKHPVVGEWTGQQWWVAGIPEPVAETAYALKQLTQGGVRVFLYLEDCERTIDSPTEKLLMSVAGFADELEREKARQRTRDAMLRKARARHVTGGRIFGYRNEPVLGPDGAHQHVIRVVDPEQAPIVERIFRLCAEGAGITRIAKTLNAEGIQPPRRASGWAASAIREILLREPYRGVVTWGKVRKRDQWGRKAYRAQPEAEWVRQEVPELRIVSDTLWQAARRASSEPAIPTCGGRAGSSWRARRCAIWIRPTSYPTSPGAGPAAGRWPRSQGTSSAMAVGGTTVATTTPSAGATSARIAS